MNDVDLGHLHISMATTFRARAQGLIGKPALSTNEAIWIRPCNSVHSCFMGSPIDVVFIGAGDLILRVVHQLKPWSFAFTHKAKSVLELAAGEAAALDLHRGCRLYFRPNRFDLPHFPETNPSTTMPKVKL